MSLFVNRFRDWWQVPGRAGDRLEHRQVTFLELFYDLVYVVLIAQLSHALAAHLSWEAMGSFTFLFIVVWWAWFNGTSYHDLHGNNDIRTRVFTFLQMLSVVEMAIFAHDAMGETSAGFALSYAVFQLILTYLWWRTGVHDPNHRPLSRPYVAVFLLNTFLFVVSIWIPTPWRFFLWGLALLLSLLLPIYVTSLGKKDAAAQAEIDIVTAVSPSMVERFGLFTIIVLGEVIVGVVNGVTEHHHLNWTIGITALLGTIIGIALWWVYFDSVSHRLPRKSTAAVSAWFYLHLPLAMGIAAVGAAILNVVEHAGEHLPAEVRWLLVIAIVIVLVSIAVLIRTIQLTRIHQQMFRVAGRVILIVSLLIFLLGFSELDAIPLLFGLAVLMLAPILTALWIWLKLLDQDN